MRNRLSTTKSPRVRAALVSFFVALLLCGAGAGFYLFYLYRQLPAPTIGGWKAHVTTYAGDGAPGRRDGPRRQARFDDPFGVAVSEAGEVYVADAGANNRILRVTEEGAIVAFAGGATEGLIDGAGAAAAFHTPSAIAFGQDGNLYVADTGNHAVRRVTTQGQVTTLAGDGTPGHRDGAAREAQFNAPIGIAVDRHGNVYVADTYNDRIRMITSDGREVRTIAGGATFGYQDGPGAAALFDTPCAVAVAPSGEVWIADTGNNRLRKIGLDGAVTSPALAWTQAEDGELESPLGLTITHDNYLYLTEGGGRARTLQIAPDLRAHVVAGGAGRGFSDGDGISVARFNRPAGVAVDRGGELYVTDAANYLVRHLAHRAPVAATDEIARGEGDAVAADVSSSSPATSAGVPRLTAETLGVDSLLWPVDPQNEWHEVTGTMGEVRGSYDGESRHHFHSGLDVQAAYGATVRAIRDEKVANPLPNWGLGGLNEGMSVGAVTYIHMRAGRDARDDSLDSARFVAIADAEGELVRLRVRRGTRFRTGDALGTVNRMYHVHLNLGPWSAEINPLLLPLAKFGDQVAPIIERDGVQLFDQTTGERLKAKRGGNRILVARDRPVRIVVDAYDQVDGNLARRRLGLYKLGYQLLGADLTPVAEFGGPRVTMEFDRLPPERTAVQTAYADASGITVYGSAATRFLYEITNTIRAGRAERGEWRVPEKLPPGDYVLRVIAADHAGNEAAANRDVAITVE